MGTRAPSTKPEPLAACLDAALAEMRRETRQYARRQRTYLRSQLVGDSVGLRVTVTAPLWESGVDLAREADSWWPRVEAFLRPVDGGA